MATYDDFLKIDVRVGTVISVDKFPEAKKPAYVLIIDFGREVGMKKSSVQITKLYTREQLVGKQVICVVNFPVKKIGPFASEVLTLGVADQNGDVVLLLPDKPVPNGGRIF